MEMDVIGTGETVAAQHIEALRGREPLVHAPFPIWHLWALAHVARRTRTLTRRSYVSQHSEIAERWARTSCGCPFAVWDVGSTLRAGQLAGGCSEQRRW